LTVITGAGGVGKSTLLRRAAAELPPHITCLFESDPRTGFGNILRLILQNFDADQPYDEDEGALSRSCALQLRSRLEQNIIVALFLDNAHQFPDHLLRSIARHFLADPDETLLQVVLAGRPELSTKVSRAMLAPLKTRRPTLSELLPLNSAEIGAFVEQAIKTSGRSPEIFDERAIKRLMLYSNGNPGAIKSICERALQSVGESTDGAITTEMIDNAGRDCDLRQFGESEDSVILSSPPEQRDLERLRPSETFDNDRDSGSFTFLNVEDLSPAPRFPPKAEEPNRPTVKPTTAWARHLALLAILVAAGAMIPRETALTTLKQWNAKVSDLLAENHLGSLAETKVVRDPAPEKQLEPAPLVPLPGPDRPAEAHKESPREQDSSTEASPSEPVFVDRPAKMAPERQQRGPSIRTNPNQQNEILQAQISKAIESRAIMGVDVSVVEGTAYLDGRVASERQRRAAEQAARSVAGVERVRNRIAISLG
jgi:type II secretory pathway predicted ATPase ExeA